jgi:hypothetical protein
VAEQVPPTGTVQNWLDGLHPADTPEGSVVDCAKLIWPVNPFSDEAVTAYPTTPPGIVDAMVGVTLMPKSAAGG